MRILAFSDIHGNVEAVQKLISEVKGQDFEIIVFGGDFTNAIFDGPIKGKHQMQEIAALLQSLERPFYYVYGNRDIFPTQKRKYGIKWYCIQERDWIIGDYTLTNKIKDLNRSKILVTHSLHLELMYRQANALLYLYGHDHIGRTYKNYLDLGLLYRGKEAHGAARAILGCYWFIDLENNEVQIENHSWQLKKSICPIHKNQGVFYIPYYWRDPCPLCYDEEKHKLYF